MINLFLRSALVLALLFGLLFAIGMVAVVYLNLPVWVSALFALVVVGLQYLLGPYIIQWIYKVEWLAPEQLDPDLLAYIENVCQEKNIPMPRLGLVHDGNPNAFTFGHYPGDARLVVTQGLLDMLTAEETKAVVGHELGHIAHWDFVVMTVAGAVPVLLYAIYIATRNQGRSRDKGGGYIALVGLVSWLAYLVSQYIVLLLSRVREYFADQFAGQASGNPDALATALVKVAYGMARAPQEKQDKNDLRLQAGRAFGVFDPKVAQALALTGAGAGNVSPETMQAAMQWDLWNPWARWYELSSSHPLPAKRILRLQKQTEAQGRASSFLFRAEQPESYWDEFLVDVGVTLLPLLGFLIGCGVFVFGLAAGYTWLAAGAGLLVYGVANYLYRRFVYPPDLTNARTVRGLVSEVKVSRVRAIPGYLNGKIIGRGVPGLFYSEDLVLQDESGYITLDYRQPLRLFEVLWGWLRAGNYVGQAGQARGWYRRTPRPVFELLDLTLEDGKVIKAWVYALGQFWMWLVLAAGVVLTALGFFLR